MPGPTDGDDPVERLLDLFVYAPIGLLATAGEDLDEYVRKGRERAVAARMVGEFALKGVDERIGRSIADIEGMARQFLAIVLANAGPARREERSTPAGAGSNDVGPTVEGVDDLVADYDHMTARDLLPLLDGLDDAALARLEIHETSHRNRSTVLSRIRRLRS